MRSLVKGRTARSAGRLLPGIILATLAAAGTALAGGEGTGIAGARAAGGGEDGGAVLHPLPLARLLSPASEAPGFGDPYFDRFVQEAVPVLSASNTEGTIEASAGAPGGRKIFLQSFWGNLAAAPGTAKPQKWGGFLESTRGAALPEQVIRFEVGDGILPKPEANVLQWRSSTFGYSDGLLAQVDFPAPPPGSPKLPDFVTFHDPHLTRVWAAVAAGTVNLLRSVDTTGNRISIAGLAPLPGKPAGFSSGAWNQGPDVTQPGGVFAGKWTDPKGMLLGQLQGQWIPDPQNPPGGQILGKVIRTDGTVHALLNGTYVPAPAPAPGGKMRGFWIDPQSGLPMAVLRGNYEASLGTQGGFYQFAWLDPGF